MSDSVSTKAVSTHTTALPPLRTGGYPGRWIGRFIWDDGEATPYHYHLMARKTFDLPTAPRAAQIKITASDKYMLWVNGQYLGRGPARNARPQWTSYDTYDLATHLHAGLNTLAVLAYHYGCPNAYSSDMRAGLFAELEVTGADGNRQNIATDASWRVRPFDAYRRDVPTVNGWLGIPVEIYEAAKNPDDWMQPGFEDTSWKPAKVLVADYSWENLTLSPWSLLEPRRTAMLCERVAHPAKVVSAFEVLEAPLDLARETDVCARLKGEEHRPLERAKVGNAEGLIRPGTADAMFQSSPAGGGEKEACSPAIILDFGRPLFGFPRLTFEAPAGAVIDITYGNALAGGRVEIDGASKFGDRCIASARRQTWQLFEGRQFRYLQIVVRNAAVPVSVESVSMVCLEYPLPVRGSFACSDPVLTKLWQAGVDTLFLHMEDTVVCDATRERRQYCVQATLETVLYGLYPAWGDRVLVEWLLLQTKRAQLPDGRIVANTGSRGSTGLGMPVTRQAIGTINPLCYPNEQFAYALCVWEHYWQFGDTTLLAEHYPALVRIAEFYEARAEYEGLIYNLPNMNWMDWFSHELRGANFYVNAGYAAMLDALSRMANILDLPRDEEKWKSRAADIRATLRRLHWNEEQGLFTDSVIDGKQSPVFSELTNGIGLLFDVPDAAETRLILGRLADRNAKIIRASPLTIYYVIEGMIKAGADVDALRHLSERFAPVVSNTDVPMIPEGWPEQADTGASKSHIHSSGCGLVQTLSAQVLGIRPTKPGFTEAVFDPRPGTLQWAKGVIPAPLGDIKVEWKRSTADALEAKIEAPEGVKLANAQNTGAGVNTVRIRQG